MQELKIRFSIHISILIYIIISNSVMLSCVNCMRVIWHSCVFTNILILLRIPRSQTGVLVVASSPIAVNPLLSSLKSLFLSYIFRQKRGRGGIFAEIFVTSHFFQLTWFLFFLSKTCIQALIHSWAKTKYWKMAFKGFRKTFSPNLSPVWSWNLETFLITSLMRKTLS